MNRKEKIILLSAVILMAGLTRLLPHAANFSAITALGLFAAVYLPRRQAIAIPLIARLGSDLLIGFFSWPLMIAVYSAHLAGVVLGLWVKRSEEFSSTRWMRIGTASIGSAMIFFLVTNFVGFYPEYYPQNLSGLLQAYANGLPFLRGTLLSDVGFSVALFGTWQVALYYLQRRPQHLQTAAQES